jgi:hypothetical protein
MLVLLEKGFEISKCGIFSYPSLLAIMRDAAASVGEKRIEIVRKYACANDWKT